MVPDVNIFILISGYFAIKWKLKKLLGLIFQVYFWTFVVYFALLISGCISFDMKGLVLHLNALLFEYWFIPSYLLLYLVSPILNKFVESTSRTELRNFIIVYYVVQTYWALFAQAPFGWGYDMTSFIGLYLIGRYIRNYKIGINYKTKHLLCLLMCLYLVNTLLSMGEVFVHGSTIRVSQYNSPLVIMEAVIIFLLFERINIESKFINWISSSVLSIYLLHMQLDMKPIYMDYGQSLYQLNIIEHLFKLFVLIGGLCTIAVVFDKLRIFIFDKLYYFYDKLQTRFSICR